jgi:hypothetical protein
MTDLLTRARNMSAMLRMCEKISFGSDADIIDELVSEISRLHQTLDRISDISAGRDNLDGFPRARKEKQRRLAEIYQVTEESLND